MARLTIRNIDDSVTKQLRIRAAEHGCSMEDEARRILLNALNTSTRRRGLGSRIYKAVMAVSGPVNLVPSPRTLPRSAPDFSDDAS